MAKPTDIPRWADVGGDIVEPASGKKDIGWVSDEKPPAQWFNWWMNTVGDWFTWLNDFFFDGPVSGDFEVTGLDVTTGTDQDGGDLALSGGSSTGSGSSVVEVKAAVAGASGVTVRTPETFLKADGATGKLNALKEFEATVDTGIIARGTGTAGEGVIGYGKGTGTGVYGEGESGNNAYGLYGQGAGGNAGVRGDGEAGQNARGVIGNGKGTSAGVYGAAEAGNNAYGVQGQGGGSYPGVYGLGQSGQNANGVEGQGRGTGRGVQGTGGTTSGAGVRGVGGSPDGVGVIGEGDGDGDGVQGTGGDTGADGGLFNGSGAFYGVRAFGGPTNGVGVYGGGDGSGHGVRGVGDNAGSGDGVHGTTLGTGNGVYGSSSGTDKAGVQGVGGSASQAYGVIAQADTTSPDRSAFRIVPQDSEPDGPNQVGDVYVTTSGVMKICTVAGTPGTFVSVGSQT